MMTLSWFHEPPRAFGVSASTVTGPPSAGTFFRCPSAKNPRDFASADQNGNEPPSVPSNFLAVKSLKRCTQIASLSLFERAQKATAEPSGAIAGGPEKSPVKSNPVSVGGGRYERSVCSGVGERSVSHNTAPSKSAANPAHSPRSSHFAFEEPGAARAGASLAPEPLVAIQRSSRPISAALCQRASGSFARHPCKT